MIVCRSQPPGPPGQEDEAEEEEGLCPGRPGQAGAEGHERCRPGEEQESGGKGEGEGCKGLRVLRNHSNRVCVSVCVCVGERRHEVL